MKTVTNSRNAVFAFLNQPEGGLAKRYFVLQFGAIMASIAVVFIEIFFPGTFLLGSLELFLVEILFLLIFGSDLLLRLYSFKITKKRWETCGDIVLLILDLIVVTASAIVISKGIGDFSEEGSILMILRAARLGRVLKLVRKANMLEAIFGKTVFSKVAGDIILIIGFEAVFSIGLKSVPGLKEALGMELMTTGVSFLLVILGLIAAAAIGLTYTKSYELNKATAKLISSIRALADDLPEFQGDQKKVSIRPLAAEKHLGDFFDGKIKQAEFYAKMDQWCTECFRAFRDHSEIKHSQAALAAISGRADALCAMAAEVSAIASHHHPMALYAFMDRVSYAVLILLAIPMAQGLGGILVTCAATFAVRGSLFMLKDTDFSLDKVLDVFNTPMPKFPDWPSRS